MREFSVWAPHAERVELLLPESSTEMVSTGSTTAEGSATAGGWWRVSVPVEPESTYAFCLDGGEPRPDPRGLRLPHGPHGWSQLYDPTEFPWSDSHWPGAELSGAVIYELHVGTFTAEGTLDAAAARLEHLVELEVTVVELMPLAPFPGRHGWGYDGVAPYAVHEPYGGPAALQRFVDAAHGNGLGVCLDVVYNHLGPDGNYLAEFGPYLTDKHETPWGRALNLDDADSDPVRRWVLDNVAMWLGDFHLDALRLDAVHELHDDRALTLLEEMSAETDALAERVGRRLTLIAESDRNDPATVTPRDRAGALGLHAQWADDVHHGLHVTLTGETQGYYADFAAPGALAKVLTTPFFHDGTWSSFRARTHGRPVDRSSVPGRRFVASLQTHDQVGNRATGDRLSAQVPTGVLACGAALLLTSPYTPMLFMGEEWGASTPWQYFTDHTDPDLADAVREGRRSEFAAHGWDRAEVPDPQDAATVEASRLDWSELERDPHRRLLQWYRDLIRLRRSVPDLRDDSLEAVAVDHDAAAGTVVVSRGAHRVLVNLSEQTRTFPIAGRVLLAWAQPEPLAADGTVDTADGTVELAGHSAAVIGP